MILRCGFDDQIAVEFGDAELLLDHSLDSPGCVSQPRNDGFDDLIPCRPIRLHMLRMFRHTDARLGVCVGRLGCDNDDG